MLKWIIATAIALSASHLSAEEMRAEDQDKQLHFLASWSINSTILATMPKRTKYKHIKAAAVTATMGVAKELTDPKFSNADLAADGLGILTSSALTMVFEF